MQKQREILIGEDNATEGSSPILGNRRVHIMEQLLVGSKEAQDRFDEVYALRSLGVNLIRWAKSLYTQGE